MHVTDPTSRTTPKTDAERLANIKAFVTDPDRMKEWDSWAAMLRERRHGSWPRDAYECILDWVRAECEDDD